MTTFSSLPSPLRFSVPAMGCLLLLAVSSTSAGCGFVKDELDDMKQLSEGSRPDGAELRTESSTGDEQESAQDFLRRNRTSYSPTPTDPDAEGEGEGDGPRARTSFILGEDDGEMSGAEISISGAEIDMSETAAAPRGQLSRPAPGDRAPVFVGAAEEAPPTGEAYVDMDAVESAIGSRAREFTTYCLDFAGFRNESLQRQSGVMRLDLTLGESGRINRVRLAANSDVTDETLLACLDESFRRMQLPRPTGGSVDFTYPIRVER